MLLLSVHHIVSDGWSTGVLWRELSSGLLRVREWAASLICRGCRFNMPTTPSGSASGCRARCSKQQLAYWREQLADLSTLELPTDRPRPPVPSNQGAHLAFDLPAPLTAGAQGAEPARRGDAVHDAAGRLPGAAAPLQRPGRHRGGHADRRAPAHRDWKG